MERTSISAVKKSGRVQQRSKATTRFTEEQSVFLLAK